MFGYVTVYKPELKIKEYESYKGVYCTLCKNLQKEYGFLSRFLLSYDGAFYIIFKAGLKNSTVCAENSRCSFNPAKKCLKVTFQNDLYVLSCAIVVLLAYFKLKDNIKDSKGIKKMLFYVIYPYFAHIKNKAKKKYSDIYDYLEKGMEKQFQTEQKANVSIDESAHETAQMLSYLFAYGEEEKNQEFAKKFGYCLGRVVYFIDAFDDYEKDMKTNSFNPFKNSKDIVNDATFTVNLSIGELARILEENPVGTFNEITNNIVYEGLNYQLNKISQKYRGDGHE